MYPPPLHHHILLPTGPCIRHHQYITLPSNRTDPLDPVSRIPRTVLRLIEIRVEIGPEAFDSSSLTTVPDSQKVLQCQLDHTGTTQTADQDALCAYHMNATGHDTEDC